MGRLGRGVEPVAWWDGGLRLTRHKPLPEQHVWERVIPLYTHPAPGPALSAQGGEHVGTIGHVSHGEPSITAAILSMQGGEQTAEVEVIDPYVMDLVRKHGHNMTNSEIVQRFLPKQKLSTAATVSVPREPTEVMIGAYVRAVSECKAPTWYEAIRVGYAAMLAAAKEGKS